MNPELNWLKHHLAEDRGHFVRYVDDCVLVAADIDGEHAFIVREIDGLKEGLEQGGDGS